MIDGFKQNTKDMCSENITLFVKHLIWKALKDHANVLKADSSVSAFMLRFKGCIN